MRLKLLMAILISLCLMTASYGQGWERLYEGDTISAHFIDQTVDGGFFIGAIESPPTARQNTYLLRVNVNGDTLWTKDIDNLSLTSGARVASGGYALAGSILDFNTFKSHAGIIKVDDNGNTLWTKQYIGAHRSKANSIQQTTDGGYILAGFKDLSGSYWDADAYLVKTDANGDTLWTKRYGASTYEIANSVQQTTDGGYILVGNQFTTGGSPASSNIYLVKTDANGDTLWTKTYGGNDEDVANSIQQTTDGGYIIAGYTKSFGAGNKDVYLIKTDASGITLWTKTFGAINDDVANSVVETVDGGYLLTGDTYTSGLSRDIYILKTDPLGNLDWSKSYGGLEEDYGTQGILSGNGYAVIGWHQYWVSDPFFGSILKGNVYLLRMDSLGNTFTNYIKGNIFNDANLNCLDDLGEDRMSGILVSAVGSQTLYGVTDSIGNYCIRADTGSYVVTANLPIYWQACNNNIPITFSTIYTNDTINFSLQAQINCPMMEVDISAPFIRTNGAGSSYSVNYCNRGTVDETNVSIEVVIDGDLDILSTSLPIASQVGNTLTFNIGSVAYGACGSFGIQVRASLNSILGQTHCSQAHIFPDSLCLPNAWLGPIIDASATCQNDSIAFKLENIGGGLFNSETYYVFEDHFIMRTGPTGNILVGDSFDLSIPADTGKTYRISVAQNSGFPKLLNDTIASAAIEGCVPYLNGTFNTGFITQFSNGNSSPFIAVDCQPNIGSYDPNDKSAQPKGYDTQNYIYNYTDLDYKIRFQNTGTDTAFLVVIRDTISPLLDLSTLTMGASSHNYTWRVYGERVLEITYNNIMLPDSNVNEPASNGFVRYRIEQHDGNVSGDVIYNAADIYFDFNAPIRTNQTFHTIGENFVTIMLGQTKVLDEVIQVKVYPNPFTQNATLEVEGKEYKELQLTIYDVSGRVVGAQQTNSNNKIEISRGDLQPGVYFYQLLGDDALINTGKIVVQ